ncbi:MAG: hypothetical protein HRT82_10175 [Henriciella sp.]|jgi:hypothetical protein|nr:hypothetical protein [Henriciella sp.]
MAKAYTSPNSERAARESKRRNGGYAAGAPRINSFKMGGGSVRGQDVMAPKDSVKRSGNGVYVAKRVKTTEPQKA